MSESAVPDYSGYTDEDALPDDKMERVNVLANRQVLLAEKVSRAEAALHAAKAEWSTVACNDLVTHTISVPLTAGQTELAQEVKAGIQKLNAYLQSINTAWSIDVLDKEDINAARLSAWVRKQLDAGEVIPEDLLNVHRSREVKIKSK